MSPSEAKSDVHPPSSKIHILVVEDEPLIRFGIAEALRDLQASVVEAATADEAWDYLASGASVDVVFTDHRMPGSMTGSQLAARIARQYPAVKIVLTSAFLDDRAWKSTVVSKPYDLAKTAAALVTLARQNEG
jgi:CheY-like chemotaxis protein